MKMVADGDIPTGKNIADTVTDLIENTKYMEVLEKATNLRRYDSVAELTLGNLASALGNDTAQNVLASRISNKNESYLVKLADQFKRLPKNASIVVTNVDTLDSFTINYTLVNDVKEAESIEELCDAFAAIFKLDGIKDMSISEFYDGQIVTFKAKDHSASCVLWIKAE